MSTATRQLAPNGSEAGATIDRLVLTVLAADGIAVGLLSVFFMPLWAGPVPIPVAALVAGIVNVLLVRAAERRTTRMVVAALPLVGWLAVFALFAIVDGGGTVIPGDWRAPVLLLLGAGPAAMWLAGRALDRAGSPAEPAPAGTGAAD